MKKVISYIILLVMCISLVACGKNATTNNGNDAEASKKEEEKRKELEKPYDVPKILVYTNGEEIIKEDYIPCELIIVDEAEGTYETIRDDAATIKIRGNSTSTAEKKPYNIKFSEKTDVFGMGENKKWSLLANCYDKTLIRNLIVFDVAKQLNVPYTPDYKVVDLYVDNVLQGNYLLVDSIQASPTRVDIDTSKNEFLIELDYNPRDPEYKYILTNEYRIKFAINEPRVVDLTDDQLTYVKDLIDKAEAALSSGNMEEIEKYFDIESMANFYLVLEFFRNVDVNTSSTRFHIKDGKIYGGPVWDFDLSSGNYRWDYYTSMYDYMGNSYGGLHAVRMPWFGALVQVDEFQNVVNQKFLDNQELFVNLYQDNEKGQNHIDKTIATYKESIDRNNGEAGWDPSKIYDEDFLERYPESTYEANVEYFRKWLRKRNEWLLREWELNE
ncbi:MAG: CotH kinase family protein [Agathobacter sp.]|nr:CotH kinase family protein [Agathobacter sp.]